MEEGNKNEVLEAILQNSPTTMGTKVVQNESINVALLLPENQAYYHYSGSLTTPPCSEGFNWNVMKTPIQASKEQIEKFMAIYSYNSRPIQPLYDRTVEMRP